MSIWQVTQLTVMTDMLDELEVVDGNSGIQMCRYKLGKRRV